MNANESRPKGAASEADGPTHDSTGTAITFAEIDSLRWRLEAGAIRPVEVPIPLLSWYEYGISEAAHYACEGKLAAAEREADRLYFELHNPESSRQEAARTLRLIETARGREADARRRAALDRLQAADRVEYARVVWLGLTNRVSYIEALEPWAAAS